jgi:hypothetical protein
VLDDVDRSSSLVASLSVVVELLEGWVDTVATNGVHWGARSVLVAALSHFPELKTELGLLGSRRNVNLTEDEADALWARVSVASFLLASNVPSLVASGPRDGAGE